MAKNNQQYYTQKPAITTEPDTFEDSSPTTQFSGENMHTDEEPTLLQKIATELVSVAQDKKKSVGGLRNFILREFPSDQKEAEQLLQIIARLRMAADAAYQSATEAYSNVMQG